jgi:hypothetical protein
MGYGQKNPQTVKIEHPDITQLTTAMAEKALNLQRRSITIPKNITQIRLYLDTTAI